MIKVSFPSLKGGVGKSSITITEANLLGAAGQRVCVIDIDLNNSVTYYFLPPEAQELAKEKNIAQALFHGIGTDLNDFIIKTNHKGVSIIPSSLNLVDLRSLGEHKLASIINSLESNFDVVLIDVPPTYDSLVLNAFNASDLIITPVNPSQFDFNTAVFLRDKLKLDTNKFDNWFITFNGYNHRYQNAKSGIQRDYVELFQETFDNLTPIKTWIPWTPCVRKYIDRDMKLSKTKISAECMQNPELFDALYQLANSLVDINLPIPEEF